MIEENASTGRHDDEKYFLTMMAIQISDMMFIAVQTALVLNY